MVQARTDASIMRRLHNFVASVFASRIDADYRGSGNRCLTIKNNYVISIADHRHPKFGERNRYGLPAQWLEKHLAGDPGCDLTKVRDRRIIGVAEDSRWPARYSFGRLLHIAPSLRGLACVCHQQG